MAFIIGDEIFKAALDFPRAGLASCGEAEAFAQHRLGAGTDETAHRGAVDCRQAGAGERMIHGSGEVVSRINQRAVKVENSNFQGGLRQHSMALPCFETNRPIPASRSGRSIW